MKKLMIMAAVALAAIVSQAATATWAATNIYQPESTTAKLSGAVAYLFEATSIPTTLADDIKAGNFTGAGAIADAKTSSTGGISKTGIGDYSSQTVSMYMVLFDNATIASSTHFKIAGTVSQTYGATGNKTFNFSTALNNASWQSVPEPTSAMLILLGVAGLALRRKQK